MHQVRFSRRGQSGGSVFCTADRSTGTFFDRILATAGAGTYDKEQEVDAMKTLNRQVLVTREDDWYVAKDIATNVASQGKDIDSALENLKDAIELYYDER